MWPESAGDKRLGVGVPGTKRRHRVEAGGVGLRCWRDRAENTRHDLHSATRRLDGMGYLIFEHVHLDARCHPCEQHLTRCQLHPDDDVVGCHLPLARPYALGQPLHERQTITCGTHESHGPVCMRVDESRQERTTHMINRPGGFAEFLHRTDSNNSAGRRIDIDCAVGDHRTISLAWNQIVTDQAQSAHVLIPSMTAPIRRSISGRVASSISRICSTVNSSAPSPAAALEITPIAA